MSSDITLTAALRNNLLSLQNTQRLIDATQIRLATGLRVNSALDGPSNFFTSQALGNRASDLTRLLDSINMSLRTIEEADTGVTALTALVEQANSIAESARDELAATTAGARMVGVVDLRAVATPTTLTGIANNEQFVITTTDDTGAQIANTFAISSSESVQALLARITDTYADTRNGEIRTYLNDSGAMVIETKDGRAFKVSDASASASTQIGTDGWAALGLDRYFEYEQRGAASNTFAAANINGGNTAFSISLYESAGNLADAGDVLSQTNYIDSRGNTVISGLSTNSVINFVINNTSTVSQTLTASTSWQDIVDLINQGTTINQLVEADFDDASGQFSITALSDGVQNVQVRIQQPVVGAIFDIGLGDGTGNVYPMINAANNTAAGTFEQVISFNSSTEALDQLATDYNEVRTQIDTLVQDANFRGVNLLNGDDLTTFFNEDRSSSLTIEGAVFTAQGLGMTEATFRTAEAIEADLDRIFDALGEVRGFGATLANRLSIIQTRKNFTEQTVNTLKAGAGDLTLADQNEEGANLLALQTRQALGVTSLSLASQSQQAVLRLF